MPRSATVGQLVAAQAAARPDGGGRERYGAVELTYRALMVRRDQIAARLRALGVGVGDRVGVCVDRTPAMVAALLGIWEAGAAYVPLDPAFPAERLAYMVRDAAVGVVISDGASLAAVPAGAATVLRLDVPDDWSAPAATACEPTAGPGDVAYVIYTSGSTGRPKGVEVPHRAVVNFLTSMAATPGLTGAGRASGGDDAVVRHRGAGAVAAVDGGRAGGDRERGRTRATARRCWRGWNRERGDGAAGDAGDVAAAARSGLDEPGGRAGCCAAARRCRASWPTSWSPAAARCGTCMGRRRRRSGRRWSGWKPGTTPVHDRPADRQHAGVCAGRRAGSRCRSACRASCTSAAMAWRGAIWAGRR